MIYFFEIPIFWIIVLLILLVMAGVTSFVENIAYILFTITQIIFIFTGIKTVKKMFSEIKRTNRTYMIIPAIIFLIFSFLGLFICYECLCMSESYIEVERIYYEPLGTLNLSEQTYHVRVYAILICWIVTGIFKKLFPMAFEQEAKKGKISCLLCALAAIVPIFGLYHICNKQYYDRNTVRYEDVCELKEDVFLLWKDIDNSERSEISYVQIPIIQKIKAGEMLYLTGEEMTMNNTKYVEIFIKEENVIGYVSMEKLQ